MDPEAIAKILEQEGHPAWRSRATQDPIGPPMQMVPESASVAVAVAASVAVAEGAEGLDTTDLAVPYMHLAQDQTTVDDYDVPAGIWYLSSDPEGGLGERSVSILDVTKGREFLAPYKKPDEDRRLRSEIHSSHGVDIPDGTIVYCRSVDRVLPVSSEHAISARCKGCPYSAWRSATGGSRLPPLCGETYSALVLDHATQLPAWLRVKSTAIKPFRNLLTRLLMSCRVQGEGVTLPLAAFSIQLAAKKVIKGGDKFHVPTWGDVDLLEDDVVSEALSLRRAILG